MSARYDLDLLALELDEWLPRNREDAVAQRIDIDAIADHLLGSRAVGYAAIRHHRRYLATPSWAVLTFADRRSHFVYWLSADPVEISAYESRRIDGDTMSRLRTLRQIADRAVHYSDGRTLDGRRARLIRKTVARLIEDIEDMAE